MAILLTTRERTVVDVVASSLVENCHLGAAPCHLTPLHPK